MWTKEELAILKEKYPKIGPNIPELLKHHTRSAILSIAASRTIRYRKTSLWTEEEIEILKEKYPTYGSSIPGLDKTPMQIRCKVRIMPGLRCSFPVARQWRKKEDSGAEKPSDYPPLIDHYCGMLEKENGSIEPIRRKAHALLGKIKISDDASVAALIYVAGLLCRERISQRVLADVSDTNWKTFKERWIRIAMLTRFTSKEKETMREMLRHFSHLNPSMEKKFFGGGE